MLWNTGKGLAALLAIVVAGCGGGERPSARAPAEPAGPAVAPPPAPPPVIPVPSSPPPADPPPADPAPVDPPPTDPPPVEPPPTEPPPVDPPPVDPPPTEPPPVEPPPVDPPPVEPVGLRVEVAPPAVAVVRVPLSPAPVVQLVDALGAAVPLAGVPIGVTTVDGATLTGEATRLTDDRGRAVFDGLAFSGRAAGARALRFAGPGAPLVSAAIDVQAGPPARLVGISALAQVAAPLAAVTEPPGVRVEDLDTNPAAGVTVEFAVSAGGGTLGGATAVSDAAGLARVERWTLGAGGDQAVVASIPLAPLVAPLAFAATTAPPPPRYAIELRFVTPASAGQQSAFERARRRIEAVVVGDLPDVTLPAGSACAGEPLGAPLVDDLLIVVRVEPIDGPGLILGQAGPCLVRVAGLPVAGIMMFDEADLGRLEADGRLDSVILHEMLHVVGFGVLWNRDGLVAGAGGADPVFVGPRAREQFAVHDGGVETAGGVPVEGSGGAGTAGAHWRETVFGSELMTGWLTGVSQPLGGATAGSLADLGYEVDVAAADDFRIGGLPRALAGPPLPALSLEGDVLPLAPVEVDAAGVPVAR